MELLCGSLRDRNMFNKENYKSYSRVVKLYEQGWHILCLLDLQFSSQHEGQDVQNGSQEECGGQRWFPMRVNTTRNNTRCYLTSIQSLLYYPGIIIIIIIASKFFISSFFLYLFCVRFSLSCWFYVCFISCFGEAHRLWYQVYWV